MFDRHINYSVPHMHLFTILFFTLSLSQNLLQLRVHDVIAENSSDRPQCCSETQGHYC